MNNGVAAKFSERMNDTDGSPDEIFLSFELAGYAPENRYVVVGVEGEGGEVANEE